MQNENEKKEIALEKDKTEAELINVQTQIKRLHDENAILFFQYPITLDFEPVGDEVAIHQLVSDILSSILNNERNLNELY